MIRFDHAARAAGCAAAALALGFSVTAAAGPADQKGPGGVTPIPRKIIFGNPERSSPQISHDGKQLAFLAPVDGVMNVWVGPIDNPSAAKPVTKDKVRGIRMYQWAFNNQHILYQQDKGGDENWRIYATDVKSGETKDLTPFDKVAARIQETSPNFPDEILVALNNRVEQFHDIHRVNLRTGESTLVQKNDDGQGGGYAGFVTDEDFKVRFAADMNPDGSQTILRPAGSKWETFIEIPHNDTLTTGPIGFNKDGSVLYLQDSRGRNTSALFAMDIATGESRLLIEDRQCDLDTALFHPTEKTPQAVEFNYDRRKWQVLDRSLEPDFATLRRVVDGDFSISSRSLDDQHWIVAYIVDTGPVRYYHYDRGAKTAKFLFTNRPELEKATLAKMFPRVIPARDGLKLVSYLSLPPGSDPDGDGKPDQPLPMVLNVHGGPWARDEWGLDPEHQWLATRGYAVLSVNFRGSTGFGKEFINAADKQWAAKMHDDLLDAVNWAVEQKIADGKRVAIYGGSYGGYATLVGLTFTPEVFACGVDIVGPSNLNTLLNSIPPYWTPMIELFAKRVGDHRTEEGKRFLDERSPLSRVDQIKRPLLIGQGANDPRVKQAESDQIVKAMNERKIPVTYVLYPDEGHGFARPENRLSFYAVAEAFLGHHLGGVVEPIGDDFKGSSIQIPSGADQVPGLKDAAARLDRKQ